MAALQKLTIALLVAMAISATNAMNNGLGAAFVKAVDQMNGQNQERKNPRPPNPGDMFAILRAANGVSQDIASAAELYERIILNLQKEQNIPDGELKEHITKAELIEIAELAGCIDIGTPDCASLDPSFRTFDGTCNNLQMPRSGAAMTPFKRLLPPRYENDFNSAPGADPNKLYHKHLLPNVRAVSVAVMSTPEVTDDVDCTGILVQWGQFMDHDIDFTPTVTSNATYGDGLTCDEYCQIDSPCFPIPFPEDDPRNTTAECMGFIRSASTCGINDQGPGFLQRQQLNSITAYIDASNVYGSSLEEAENLRDLESDIGLLREGVLSESGKPMLPFDYANNECLQDPYGGQSVPCFIAGDIRSNENLGLITMHTMFLREHNRIAIRLKTINNHWDEEKIYQETRKIIGAMLQHITYNEFLPIILGVGMQDIGEYRGYNPGEDASIANEFATAAFRYGHGAIQPIIPRLDENWQTSQYGHLELHKGFFSPFRLMNEGGPEQVLRGMLGTYSKLNLANEIMNEELTEKLFALLHLVAFDLAALNIQRGRDHGLPSYTEYRKLCRLPEVHNFGQLRKFISNREVVDKLEDLYGDVRNIDLFVGGMIEDKVTDSRTGPVFNCIIAKQFKSLRDGDRYWYENPGVFTGPQRNEIRKVKLSKIFCGNGEVTSITPNAFRTLKPVDCPSIPHLNVHAWRE